MKTDKNKELNVVFHRSEKYVKQNLNKPKGFNKSNTLYETNAQEDINGVKDETLRQQK